MYRSRILAGVALFSFAILIDQITKAQVRALLPIGTTLNVAGPVYLTHVENTGSVFGLGQGYVLIPTIATILILVAIPWIVRYLHRRYSYTLTILESACAGLIAGGAIGNLVDRLFRSAVTDFIDVHLFAGLRWPAFNVADASVVVGTFILFVAFMRHSGSGATLNANS